MWIAGHCGGQVRGVPENPHGSATFTRGSLLGATGIAGTAAALAACGEGSGGSCDASGGNADRLVDADRITSIVTLRVGVSSALGML